MLTYTTYSEAGGVGKTTIAANLADVHTQRGRDVLVIDLDPQQGSLTFLLDIPASRGDDKADNIARHLIDRPKGGFNDLIRETPYGFDVVPSHNMLESLPGLLTQAQEMAEDLGKSLLRTIDYGKSSPLQVSRESTIRLSWIHQQQQALSCITLCQQHNRSFFRLNQPGKGCSRSKELRTLW